jgi:hypothetical protein
MNFSWMSSPQYLAQAGHFFGALSVILVAALFSTSWEPIWWVFGTGIATASFKEFVFDVAPWGEGDSWFDSIMDWTFYVLGGSTGMVLAACA